MTGSAGTVLDVMVNARVSNGRRVWEEGCDKFYQVRPAVDLFEGWRIFQFFSQLLLPYFVQMYLKHYACHTFRASSKIRRGLFWDSFLMILKVFRSFFAHL